MTWVLNASPEVDAISQWQLILAVCVALSVVSASVVLLRLWVRARSRGMAADDWMATLSLIFAILYSIICIWQTKYGLGLPLALRPKENLVPFTKVNYAGRPIYQIGISFFKIALLISYLRLFDGTNQRVYRHVVWVSIALVFLSHLGCAMALILACSPVEKSWNPLMTGKCLAPGPSFTGYAVVTIVSDILVALIPIPMLLRLNVSLAKKLGLIGIFVLGLFTTICSIMRYLQIDRIQTGDGNSTMLILWGVIEFNVGNMVSSLPFLAPVFLRKAKEYRSKQSRGYGGSSGSRGLRNKEGRHYKLSNLSKGNDTTTSSSENNNGGVAQRKGNTAYATASPADRTGSEEDILRGGAGFGEEGSHELSNSPGRNPENSIIKSVSYTVRVDDGIGTADGKEYQGYR